MKSKLSHSETKKFIDTALRGPITEARDAVYQALVLAGFTEGQLYDAIEEHSHPLNLTSEQWLRLFQMYPSNVFRSRFDLPRLLSRQTAH
ncbi:MAG: hypothetical protein C5B49_00210 [Bdellovibrio sp.]|nr:MAG: hypothetical protein C5B49_00210 [Bdellovibrio sp.]